ncbi:MAG TPA: pilus assembly protein PilW [Arenimonas sp.]|uniref:pilus assembly protein PilW n=1 Tax=Arenimonas sp. TaxID=1872635 RepID=UPI002C287A20|nr:pilus assembly protein PilW [Arenimonas sp.]HMB57206.1 pilus assembly protein PilW [Arenimonas sp.]
MKTNKASAARRAQMQGVGLVELMIALVLGLLVVGGAIGMFISNRQTYSATESLGRVQENARVAFELMARDIREAGGNPCASSLPVADVITPSAWQNSWNNGVTGYDNGGLAGSAAGTDAIEVKSGGSSGIGVTHNAGASTFTAASGGTAFKAGDLALVCDYRQAAIFMVATATATAITYNTTARADGTKNCQTDFGLPVVCGGATKAYAFQPSTVITKLRSARWYVADNPRGGRSLYQSVDGLGAQEVVEGVRDMQLTYLMPGGADYVLASAVPNWTQVLAVRITLNMEGGEGQERVGTDTAALRRELFHVVTLRNHSS